MMLADAAFVEAYKRGPVNVLDDEAPLVAVIFFFVAILLPLVMLPSMVRSTSITRDLSPSVPLTRA